MNKQTSQKRRNARFALFAFAVSFVAVTGLANQANAQSCFNVFAAQKPKKQNQSQGANQTQTTTEQRSQTPSKPVDPRIAALRQQIKNAALIEDGSVVSIAIPDSRKPFEAKFHFDSRHETFSGHIRLIEFFNMENRKRYYRETPSAPSLPTLAHSMNEIIPSVQQALKRRLRSLVPLPRRSVSDVLAWARIKPPQEPRAMEMSDLYIEPRTRELYAALLVQMTAKIETRKIHPIIQVTEADGTKGFGVLYSDEAGYQIIRPLYSEPARSLVSHPEINFEIVEFNVVRAAPEGADERKTVSVDFGSQLGFVDFQVQTRGQIERRNKEQAEAIQKAGPNDLVPFEVVLSLQYLPDGHMAFRHGNTMIEFTSTGMDIHDSGADNARAYLANNPLFNSLYDLGKSRGAEPISLGVQFDIQKAVLDDFIASAKSYNGPDFNIFFNNCVQCPVRLMKDAGFDLLGPESTAFQRFSAILAMRLILHSNHISKTGFFLYPNSKITEDFRSYRESVGSRLTQPTSDVSEAVETGLGMLRRTFYDMTHPRETVEYWRKVRERKQKIKDGKNADGSQPIDSAPPTN